MVCSVIKNIRLKGLSLVLGENKKVFEEEPFYYNNDEKRLAAMKKTIGVKERYVVNKGTTSLDLANEAAKKLINKLNIDAKTIDAVIFVTQTPDYRYPGNAHVFHKYFGGGYFRKGNCCA